MKDKKEKTLDFAHKVWTTKFQTAFKTKWKSKGLTQEKFADAINDAKEKRGLKGGCSGQQVSKWLNESIPEPENIELICEVLELSPSYFEPSHDDNYLESTQFITELGRSHVEFAEEIGLNLNLVKALHGLMNFGTSFPIYSNIILAPSKTSSREYARNSNFSNSAPIDKSLDYFQFERDNKTLTMHRADLVFLKQVQEEVVHYTEYLFHKRFAEMENEVEEANKRSHKKTVDGGSGFIPLKYETMLEIDRYSEWVYVDDRGPEERK